MKIQKKTPDQLRKLSHDIKNPLSVMRMNLDLYELGKNKTSVKTNKLIKVMNREIDRILKILSSGERKK